MIDKNGKIGGKVSIIDLLILIIILAAFVMVGVRFILNSKSSPVKTEKAYMSFTGTEVPNFVVDHIQLGDIVIDDYEKNKFGEVTDIETGPGYHYDVDIHGDTVIVYPDDSSAVTITSLAEGTLDGNGILVRGTRYAIGHTFVAYVGDCKLYLRISDLRPAE